jgi:hypothetical protein
MNVGRWKPAVEKRWLLLVSGIAWTAVGLTLCFLAYGWLAAQQDTTFLLAIAGVAIALPVYRLGFSRLARKNIKRIALLPPHCCLFAFQDARAYLVASFMSVMGVAMRSAPVPKPVLAIVYIAIGGGLFLSSLHYYARLLRAARWASNR